jgi:hypothetical protein
MKKLTMKELKYLAETSASGRPSLASLKRNREFQIGEGCDCHECRYIALKLGIETVEA